MARLPASEKSRLKSRLHASPSPPLPPFLPSFLPSSIVPYFYSIFPSPPPRSLAAVAAASRHAFRVISHFLSSPPPLPTPLVPPARAGEGGRVPSRAERRRRRSFYSIRHTSSLLGTPFQRCCQRRARQRKRGVRDMLRAFAKRRTLLCNRWPHRERRTVRPSSFSQNIAIASTIAIRS